MKKYYLLFITLLSVAFSSFGQNKDVAMIASELDRQTQAWNEGNLESFMEGYWHSEQLKFIGKNGVTMGWNNILERYKKAYPDQKAMGELKFDILHQEYVGKKAIFMIGKYHLSLEGGNKEGYFSVIWKKIKGKWLIVADHSS
ncbi:nuclear transport factor 2 family protein [Rapidithrix thailandica]|uniref:Nuclear transport factor 2 family protein n=1 Tax=Rapidithrix thailandica TaxID=413964 RepID=A0AAW9SH05_9BACT